MLGGILDLADVEVSDIMTHRKDIVSIDADAPPEQIFERIVTSPIPATRSGAATPTASSACCTPRTCWRRSAPAARVGGLDVVALAHAALVHPGHHGAAAPAPGIPPAALAPGVRGRRVRRADRAGDARGHPRGDRRRDHRREGHRDRRHRAAGATARCWSSGWVTLRDLNRQFGWKLPDEEAATVAGLLIYEAQRIPEIGQTLLVPRLPLRGAAPPAQPDRPAQDHAARGRGLNTRRSPRVRQTAWIVGDHDHERRHAAA